MENFTKKTIQGTERVCFRLRAAREAHGFSLETLSLQTKINKHYLLALEECRFTDIPFSSLYQKNFVKKYALALGENPEPFLSQFCIEEMETVTTAPTIKPRRTWLQNLAWSSVARSAALGLTGLTVVLYLGIQVKNTISPPNLAVIGPANGSIAYDNTITLRGATEPATTVSVNGQTIKSDEQGNFAESIALAPGVNTIVVSAKKKHGKVTEDTRHIIYKEADHFSAQTNVLGTNN